MNIIIFYSDVYVHPPPSPLHTYTQLFQPRDLPGIEPHGFRINKQHSSLWVVAGAVLDVVFHLVQQCCVGALSGVLIACQVSVKYKYVVCGLSEL